MLVMMGLLFFLYVLVRLPAAPQQQQDTSDYGGQRRVLDDRGVLFHDRPVRAEQKPEDDEAPVPQDATEEGVGHEPAHDRHAFDTRRDGDQGSYARKEVTDEDSLPAVLL